jgi:hypothetical protein
MNTQLNETLKEIDRNQINRFLYELMHEVNKRIPADEQINLTCRRADDALSLEVVEQFGDRLLSYLQKQAEDATECFNRSTIEIRLDPTQLETEMMQHNEKLTAEEADAGVWLYSEGVKHALGAAAEMIGSRYDTAHCAVDKLFTGDWEQVPDFSGLEIRMTKNPEVM